MNNYAPSGFRLLPPVIKNLLIINVIMFLATVVMEEKLGIDLIDLLGMHYFFSEEFRPHQLATYMFLHGGLTHIFFNMFALWMFGNVLENVWGPKRFLIYYVVCGLGAALIHYTVHYFEIRPTIEALNNYVLNPTLESFEGLFVSGDITFTTPEMAKNLQPYVDAFRHQEQIGSESGTLQASVDFVLEYKKEFLNAPVVVGASGSVFGLLLAFGMLFPNTMIYMYFLFPIRAKYFVLLYGVLELFYAIRQTPGDNVAHYAHLGGMLFGFILIRMWKNRRMDYFG